ncbi:MAG: tocopherol cyclase family protein [Anaerolineae bacterium]
MRKYIHTTLHPEVYHGHDKRPPYFEGWYFKLVDATEQHRLAVIPGIFIGKQHREAFVQVLDGMSGHSSYHEYAAEQFNASWQTFDVRVGDNQFAQDCIALHIDDAQRPIHGELCFRDITPYPVTLTAPGIMGWYGWIPIMECYHGLVSLDHTLEGILEVAGNRIDFTGGRGYIEKDWGQAFPSAYIWYQTNHFDTRGTCLSASIAMIPNLGLTFRGFIIALWHNRQLYRFATYTGAKVEKLELTDDHVFWVVSDGKHRLEMAAERTSGGLLHAPIRTEMHRRVNETLQSTLDVKLSTRSGSTLFSGVGRCAGLEVHGDLETLLHT